MSNILLNHHASNFTKHPKAEGAMMRRFKSPGEKEPIYDGIPTQYGQ